ncbi:MULTISPECIES: glycerol-3-phosphate responsive antiterminator [unclassified Paenibacillus]|uniref:glycerol-3-phosphate responsive antiterminator n=1 Tax=unclassified Paenibacillus TaxID=185978 RepID=UPI002F3E24F4
MYPIVDLVEHQTIGAVQAEEDLEIALNGKVNIIFLLMGSIFNVKSIIDRIKDAGKHAFLHMEFIEGIAADRSGVAYVAQNIRPTGIISTRSNLIRVAKEMDLMTIQRIFLIDRNAVAKGIKVVEQTQPDAVEIMPGVMPRIISEVTNLTPLPIIAGGLIDNQQEIDNALKAGALAVSVGNSKFWGADLK